MKITESDSIHVDLPVISPKKCGTCGKSFGIWMPCKEETIKYKTISGKIKVVYWCLDCQDNYNLDNKIWSE